MAHFYEEEDVAVRMVHDAVEMVAEGGEHELLRSEEDASPSNIYLGTMQGKCGPGSVSVNCVRGCPVRSW